MNSVHQARAAIPPREASKMIIFTQLKASVTWEPDLLYKRLDTAWALLGVMTWKVDGISHTRHMPESREYPSFPSSSPHWALMPEQRKGVGVGTHSHIDGYLGVKGAALFIPFIPTMVKLAQRHGAAQRSEGPRWKRCRCQRYWLTLFCLVARVRSLLANKWVRPFPWWEELRDIFAIVFCFPWFPTGELKS